MIMKFPHPYFHRQSKRNPRQSETDIGLRAFDFVQIEFIESGLFYRKSTMDAQEKPPVTESSTKALKCHLFVDMTR